MLKRIILLSALIFATSACSARAAGVDLSSTTSVTVGTSSTVYYQENNRTVIGTGHSLSYLYNEPRDEHTYRQEDFTRYEVVIEDTVGLARNNYEQVSTTIGTGPISTTVSSMSGGSLGSSHTNTIHATDIEGTYVTESFGTLESSSKIYESGTFYDASFAEAYIDSTYVTTYTNDAVSIDINY